MLALRIIGTVLVGLSCFSILLKNINVFSGDTRKGFGINLSNDWMVIVATLISWALRAFIIVALWVL